MHDARVRPTVLDIDDDESIRDLVSHLLRAEGYDVVSAANGPSGIRAARESSPGLILLDVMMPGINGYRVCDELQTDRRTADIPVVFLSALNAEQDRARAFALGATDYLTKPFDPATVLACVRRNLETSATFHQISESSADVGHERMSGSDFLRFKEHLLTRVPATELVASVISRMTPADMYAKAASANIDSSDIAILAAEFLGLDRSGPISPDMLDLGVLPASFCRTNLVLPIRTSEGRAFVVANPFDLELRETLQQYASGGESPRLIVADPRTVLSVLGALRSEIVPGEATRETAAASAAPRALETLVVDDDPDALDITARIVERAGHHVTIASEGASALVQLARRHFDVVLADIQMPILGGFALLDVMRKQGLSVPVVFVTGSTTPEDEAAAAHMGAVGFVHKPVTRNVLMDSIARIAGYPAPAHGVVA